MNIFTVSSLFTMLSNLGIALVIFLKNRQRKENIIFCAVAMSVGIWGLGSFYVSRTPISYYNLALFYWKIALSGAILVPVFFAHFIFKFLKLNNKKLIQAIYLFALIFQFFNWFIPDLFIGKLKFIFGQFYWHVGPKSLVFWFFYIGFYWILLIYSFLLLINFYKGTAGLLRLQLKYFILGSIVGWIGAEGCFLPGFELHIYPALFNIVISIYPLIMSYAIIRYRLMDITVAITRTTIFVAVYSIVLGIPFAIALGWEGRLSALFGHNWWIIPLSTSTILATAGPFIYLYFQRRAERKLFQEQIRYQTTLRQASLGMGRIKDLKRLVTLIVHIVTRTVRLEHSMIFLNDPEKKCYFLGAVRSRRVRFRPQETIPYTSAIINRLSVYKNPIVYDEIKQRTQDYGDSDLAGLLGEMEKIRAALIVPSFLDDQLVAVIVLGRKLSGQMFSANDLASLQILANQAALGIENSQFYDDIKKAHQQLFQAEKLAYVGTLAGSVVHEIRNPLTSIKAFLQYLPQKFNEPDFREKYERLIPKEIQRIEGIVNQLLELVKRRPERFKPVNIKDCIDATLELLSTSFQLKKLHIRTDYPAAPAMVSADEEHLRQAFMNLFLNAIQAMEEGGTLSVTVNSEGDRVKIAVSDTGGGIPPEILEKLFTPFATTKKDGIGLGLSITREIIENHKGTIRAESHSGEGSTFIVILPCV